MSLLYESGNIRVRDESDAIGWSSRIPALNKALTPIHIRRISKVLGLALAVFPFALAFVPWQQNVRAKGQVSAFAPVERTQKVKAPIKGRLSDWRVSEGTKVAKGDLIAVISDNDPELQRRLSEQLVFARNQVQAYLDKAESLGEQIKALTSAQELALMAADERITAAAQAVTEAEQELAAAQADALAANLNLTRQRRLESEGITSRRKLELTEMKASMAAAKVKQSEAKIAAKTADLAAKRNDREAYLAEFNAKINDVRAKLQSARSEAEDGRLKAHSLEIKVAQTSTLEVRAPIEGTIFRLADNASRGEVVKEGSELATIVPETDSLAVELYVDGNDIPLIREGRKVRLQFEGWPAVQFAGWPSVAVGTFGGVVQLVDVTDDKGKFRILVSPDPSEPAWPKPPYLRQGARAKGWLLLDQVTLGYELWRQINGFPPSIQQQVPGKDKFVKTKAK